MCHAGYSTFIHIKLIYNTNSSFTSGIVFRNKLLLLFLHTSVVSSRCLGFRCLFLFHRMSLCQETQ